MAQRAQPQKMPPFYSHRGISMDGCAFGWKDGLLDGKTDGWKEKWMDKQREKLLLVQA